MTRCAGLAIGLLGGSFNPAHEGHLHISERALGLLGLDRVWWLVSPQNPLKPSAGMAPFDERLAGAREIAAADARIEVSDFEARAGTRFTADTLAALIRSHPRAHFVWLMGADNLIEIPRWRNWTRIFDTVPVAIFARPSYSLRALSGPAAQRLRRHRIRETESRHLAELAPPAWVFLHTRLNAVSGTRLRAERAGTGAGGGDRTAQARRRT